MKKLAYKFSSIFLLAGILSNAGLAQEQIGVASAVNKNTTDLTLEQERKLIDAGYEIIQNHTIETDGIGRAQMLLLDGTAFSVGPNSSVVLDKFIYNPETAEGSLEVTARGLLRIVGGKVTKKQPALIRTNSATVGIRGGIGIVQTNGPQTNATFLYGTEMTVTPNCVDLDSFGDQCSPDYATTVTEPGFSVSVESEDSEPSEPVAVTEESLDALQEELEVSEEAPEEESTTEETPAEETQADEGTASEETATEETSGEDVAPESTEPETEAPAEIETEVASDDAGDSTDIEVDEGLLDSSGVSDASSGVAPEELGTAEEFELAIELETVEADDANEDSTENVAEEVTETTQETTVEVAPIFVVEAEDVVASFDENTSEISLAQFTIVNPGEQNYTVTIEGEGSDAFTYNQETNSLDVIQELDYESQESVELIVTFTSDNGDIQEVALALNVTDVDEAVVLAVEPVNTISEAAISSELIANQVNVSETVPAGTVLATFSATDPEGNALTYSLSGSGSDLMTVSESGEITLTGGLDFEANSTLTVMLEISDGTITTIEEITINVINDDEPATIAATLSSASFAETSAVGTAIASINATDPEGSAVTYTLSGTGSDNFSIDASGNITLASGLDYETATSYELTVVVDDGTYASTEVITVNVADVNEAPSLSATVAFNAFQENTATGTIIATSSVSDPEAGAITYSLSGNGSENFSVSSDGTVTLASGLDYETATAYAITLTASDGANSVSETLTINVGDINEAPSLTNSLAASSFAENVATGTTIATASASDPESQIITYSLSGTGSEKFSVDSAGNITLSSPLDYETATTYSLTLTASDGANSISNTINISVDDVVELSIALASSSINLNETVASGTSVTTTSTTTDGGAAVSYSLSGTGSDNFAVSSNGTITTASTLDYEATTSYLLTLTATDGTNTVSKDLTVNVIDINLSLSSSLAADSQDESLAIGTTIATSSNSNAEGTVVYSLTDVDNKFSINSSTGEVTLTGVLDYETKTSHDFTITATDGVTTAFENLSVNIQNLVELESGLLRYSANYSNINQSGFSASATRDNNSSLSNFMLDTVVSSNDSIASSKSIDDYISISSNTIPVSTITGNGNDSSGVSLHEITYTLPVNSDRVFAPNEASTSYLIETSNASGSSASTSGSGSAIISAAHTVNGNAWFMVLNNSSSTLSATYTSGDGSSGLDYNLYQWYSQPSYSLLSGTTCSSCTLRKSGNLSNVNYNWGNGSILGSISEKALLNISGKFVIPTSLVSSGEEQIVYFRLYSDDGVAMELNNSSIITNWTPHSPTYNTGSFTGIAGQAYDLELYWFENGGGALLQLEYRLSTSENWVTIPSSSFVIDPTFSTSSSYEIYAKQAMIGGEIYTDQDFVNFTGGSSNPTKRVVAFAVYPRENISGRWWHSNFIPSNLISYPNVALDYCQAVNSLSSCQSDYSNTYYWMDRALRGTIWNAQGWGGASSEVPEGSSLWWQVFNPSGTGVGLWAQASFYDTYSGVDDSTSRDDQESLLNVVISNVDYRNNLASVYSTMDTGLGLTGVGYWSYQGNTSSSTDGLGIIAGVSPIECATSEDSSCFWGSYDTTSYLDSIVNSSSTTPRAAMITTSDPYKTGEMSLSISYDSNTDSYSTGTFDQPIYWQSIFSYKDGSSQTDAYKLLTDFRSSDFYLSDSSSYQGFFSGIMEFDVLGNGNGELAAVRSSSPANYTFNSSNDLLEVSVPLNVSTYSNNYLDTWSSVIQGALNLKFGNIENQNTLSAYISSEVFAAELEDNSQQIDSDNAANNSLAGVMVSYNTIDNPDSDLFDSSNASMPNNSFSTWGFWAMSSADISSQTDNQNAGVHLGTWVAGEVINNEDIPSSGSASMSGAAVMNVAYRYNQSGSTYGVKKYTTTADVDVQFNWGSSGYGGNVTFSSFDSHNPIISNAGYSSFIIAINGIDSSYSGGSSFVTSNDWQGLTSLQGLLYGTSSSIESGGSFSLELIKSGDLDTTGANDFYFAEGIYLVN